MSFPPMSLPSPGGGALSLSGQGISLTRRAKAAIVVRYLLNEGAEIALEELPEDLQEILTHQMGAMRLVDKETVTTVIDEFTAELEAVGLSFPGNMAGALDALDGKISPHTANRLRKEAGVRQSGDPWTRIKGMAIEKLLPVIEEESIEISAVVLSKLDVPKAAELLGKLPGPFARQITYAVSQTSAVTPEAVDRIGLSLAAQLDAEPMSAFDVGPVERVGAILNNSTSATREEVLTGLDETDGLFASEVRKAIFTFANIPTRISPRDLPNVLRAVDQAELVQALAGAQQSGMEDVATFVFENMSGRLADQLREEIAELGKVKPADGEAAMTTVIGVIREMEKTGQLLLLSIEDVEIDE
ncbi:MAG: FliG C-terminal domain-containing protein [Aliishimia sp.]